MTILEVIDELKECAYKYGKHTQVVVNGHEGGLLDIGIIHPVEITEKTVGEWYYGQYILEGHSDTKKLAIYISPYPWGKGAGGGSY